MTVPIADQVACISRELDMRKRVYPKWVLSGRLTHDKAACEIEAMQAVLRTLLMLQPLAPLLEMPDHHAPTEQPDISGR